MKMTTAIAALSIAGFGCSKPPVRPPAPEKPEVVAEVTLTVEEALGRSVSEVLVTGLSRRPEAYVRKAISTRVGETVERSKLRADVRAVYSTGGITNIRVVATADADGVAINFVITEAPLVGAVVMEGNKRLGTSALQGIAAITINAALDPPAVAGAARKLEEAYEALGHYAAQVRWRHETVDGLAKIRFAIDEGPEARIARVDFQGAKRIKSKELTKLFALGGTNAVGDLYLESTVEAGLLRIQAEYYERGFINSKVGPPEIELVSDKVAISVPVVEGDAFRLGKITITGSLVLPEKRYRDVLSIRTGQLFRRSKVAAAIQNVTKLHQERTRLIANVTPLTNVDIDAKTVDIELNIETLKK